MIFLMGLMMSAFASSNSIEVVITGLRNANGSVAASLYAEADQEGFPDSAARALQVKQVKLESTECRFVFGDLPSGNYGIAVFHDEDNDGKVKMVLGIPREGFGFSNNPTIYFGPPSFKKTAIRLDTSKLRTEIKMKYFL